MVFSPVSFGRYFDHFYYWSSPKESLENRTFKEPGFKAVSLKPIWIHGDYESLMSKICHFLVEKISSFAPTIFGKKTKSENVFTVGWFWFSWDDIVRVFKLRDWTLMTEFGYNERRMVSLSMLVSHVPYPPFRRWRGRSRWQGSSY